MAAAGPPEPDENTLFLLLPQQGWPGPINASVTQSSTFSLPYLEEITSLVTLRATDWLTRQTISKGRSVRSLTRGCKTEWLQYTSASVRVRVLRASGHPPSSCPSAGQVFRAFSGSRKEESHPLGLPPPFLAPSLDDDHEEMRAGRSASVMTKWPRRAEGSVLLGSFASLPFILIRHVV